VNGSLKRGESGAKKTGGAFSGLGGKIIIANQALELAGKALRPLIKGFSFVVREGMEFTAQMSTVRSISKLTAEEFEALSDEAKRIGETTIFTATQAARGMEELSRAGLSATDTLEVTAQAMNLAAATGSELSEAARVTAIQFSLFKDSIDSAEEIVDLMVQTTASAPINFEQLSKSLEISSGLASSLGIEFDDLTDIIGVMGEAGFRSEKAGTALNMALARLLKPVPEVTKALDRLGIAQEDVNPKFVEFRDIVDRLNKAHATEADILTILGQESGPKFVKMIKDGAVALDNFEKKQKAANTASEAASIRQDNLTGDITEFLSALSGLALKIFEELEAPLRSFVKFATSFIRDTKRVFFGIEELKEEIVTVKKPVGELQAELEKLKQTETELAKVFADTNKEIADINLAPIRAEIENTEKAIREAKEKTVNANKKANEVIANSNKRLAEENLRIFKASEDAISALNKTRIDEMEATRQINRDLNALDNELILGGMTNRFDREREKIDQWEKEKLDIARITEDQKTAIMEQAQAKRDALQVQANAQTLSSAGNLFGALASAAALGGAKHFQAMKNLMRAQVIMSTAAGIMRAWTSPLWFLEVPAVTIAGATQLAQINATQPPQAHGGLTNVPAEQTFLLSQGERVLAPSQNRDLTTFLSNANAGGGVGGGGGDMIVNISGSTDESTLDKMRRAWEEQEFLGRGSPQRAGAFA
jgi:TP901 family phage tail tape measure protein